MSDNEIVHLGQQWPDGTHNNRFWVGAIPANVHHQGQLIVLGRECSTVEQLEAVVTQMGRELDQVLERGLAKLSAR